MRAGRVLWADPHEEFQYQLSRAPHPHADLGLVTDRPRPLEQRRTHGHGPLGTMGGTHPYTNSLDEAIALPRICPRASPGTPFSSKPRPATAAVDHGQQPRPRRPRPDGCFRQASPRPREGAWPRPSTSCPNSLSGRRPSTGRRDHRCPAVEEDDVDVLVVDQDRFSASSSLAVPRASRDAAAVESALDALTSAARGGGNLLAASVAACAAGNQRGPWDGLHRFNRPTVASRAYFTGHGRV